MTTQPSKTATAKTRPTHRVTFARIIGQDDHGNDKLGQACEIGAIWPRKNGKQGGILKLNLVPSELAQHQGVIFILPVTQNHGPYDDAPSAS
ncbi:hypothetical protein [Hyphococcus lacteus]|uniref:DUF736 domain-containing protein n=1 Tax=Hyphococcus lacteus TaxID=3143536 RepID=A0ABV3Z7M7_9PROT